MYKAHSTLSKLQWQSMKVTGVYTNLHLTWQHFSLHSLSVSYLCYILQYKHHYDCSHCAQPKRNQWNTNCKWHNNTPPSQRAKFNGPLETMSCGAISGVFLRCCSLNGSVTLRTANRWQSKALAADISCVTRRSWCRQIKNYVFASGSSGRQWAALQLPDRNMDCCCVTLWNCGSAVRVLWIFWSISNRHVCVCICRCNIKQPAALHFRIHRLNM